VSKVKTSEVLLTFERWLVDDLKNMWDKIWEKCCFSLMTTQISTIWKLEKIEDFLSNLYTMP